MQILSNPFNCVLVFRGLTNFKTTECFRVVTRWYFIGFQL